jgi:hypothetical protein
MTFLRRMLVSLEVYWQLKLLIEIEEKTGEK